MTAVGSGRRRRRRRRAAVPLGAVLVAVLLAGCAGQEQSGSPAARVATWMGAGGGGTAIGNLEVDVNNVDLAVSRHDPPGALRTVCALLAADAATAEGNLPTPDTALTDALNTAYLDAASAADDCYRGAAGDASLLRRSTEERAKVVPLLEVAVRRVAAVTGHTPSTPTTAPPSGGGDPFGG